jgi:hypothetical protein
MINAPVLAVGQGFCPLNEEIREADPPGKIFGNEFDSLFNENSDIIIEISSSDLPVRTIVC